MTADDFVCAAEDAFDRANHAELIVDDQDARRPLHSAARACVTGTAQGTVTRTRVPLPSSLFTFSVPPISHRIERQIERPSPLPLVLVVKNGSNTRGRSSGAIPQ